MPDDVIKNPNRSASAPKPPEPEHIRKKIKVQQAPASFMNDESYDFDAAPLSSNSHIIDNNDFISIGFPNGARPIPSPVENNYILMVLGKVVMHGSIEQIESKIKAIVYGEDADFSKDISVDDIVVLKRLKIKIGIFIDE